MYSGYGRNQNQLIYADMAREASYYIHVCGTLNFTIHRMVVDCYIS